MSLPTQWQEPLPGSDREITTVLVNQVGLYSASYGLVYRHDPWTGKILQTNPLTGYGSHEIRLAAPNGGTLLLVGINGHVVAMDPLSLGIKWERSLPSSGHEVVSLLVDFDKICAGSNGYVYRLDLGGEVKAMNSLSGYGDHETRLALNDNADVLFVGINGYVAALPSEQLDTILWYNDMKGSGHGVTSVAGGVGVVYAGCNGYVYRIDGSGKTTHTNNLSGTGEDEVRFATDDIRTHLWVGTNGYGIALRPDDVTTIFSESLPGSGYSVTDVADGDEVVFFANNGYVFCLDLEGKVIGTSDLPGLGKAETRLSVNSATELIVGINGNCVALTLPGFPQKYGPWMANMAAKIGPKPLRKVAIPGTHDSCTNLITSSSQLGLDNPGWRETINGLPFVREIQKAIMAEWALAQPLDVTRQLEAGIRYLDLRLQNSDRDREQNFTHGLVSGPLDDLVAQVSGYMTASGNDKEIIVLDFNHFYGFTTKAHQAVIERLLQTFGNRLAPASLGLDVTVDELWASTYRIIVFYDDTFTVSVTPFLWPQNRISSPWPDTADPTTLFNTLGSEVAKLPVSTFFVLQGVLTPDLNSILNGLVPATSAPDSLKTLAGLANGQLVKRLQNDWKSKGINIVICDWFNLAPGYVDTVVKLNT